ncbi:MAG: glycosyltransferase family 39 protein [Pyrinomonadaceae bacterium]
MAKKRKIQKDSSPVENVPVSESAKADSAANESASKPARAAKTAQPAAVFTREPDFLSDRTWLILAAIITAIAAITRFVALELRPLHHDEGVNGHFLKSLFNDGMYKYDPANYHGPTLYYISLAFTKIFGFTTIPIRMSVAIFGVLMVAMVFFLRRYIGSIGSLAAALFLALSPGMVFISRYFIHEIFFVFLSLGVVVAVVFFMEKRAAGPFAIGWMALILLVCFLPSALNLAAFIGGTTVTVLWGFRLIFFIAEAALVYYIVQMLLSWDGGRPIYLILASACVSLIFATKETGFITLGTMLLACLSVWVWRGIRDSDTFEKNWFRIVIGAMVALAFVVLTGPDILSGATAWMSDAFFNQYIPPNPFPYYSIILLAIGGVVVWALFLANQRRENISTIDEPVELTPSSFTRALGTGSDRMLLIGAVAIAFIYISVLFFSSFFTYGEGVWKAIEAYAIWTKTGNKDHTMHGYLGYVKWGLKIESPILIISLLGALIALLKGRHRFAMFTAFWAFGLFAAYSIIPYKTPWLALSFLLPMCIIAGYAIGELLASRNIALKTASIVLGAAGVFVLTYQTYQHNFVRYDDGDMPYVYAHTRRQFLDLVSEIERYAEKSGKGKEAVIEIISPDYWPMTWYMNDYTRAGFHGSPVDVTASEMIVAKKNDQDATVIQKYSNHYKYVGVYPLRPGVNLVLLVRNDLADANAQDLNKLLEYKVVPGVTS